MRNNNNDAGPDGERRLGAGRIFKAVAIGVAIYLALSAASTLYLRMQIGKLADNQGLPEENAPVYRDKDGEPISEADHDVMVGFDDAKAKGVTSHAECKSNYKGLQKIGCEKYVTSTKHFPPHLRQGNWASGKTTAECIEEVDAFWRAVVDEDREKGNDHAADSTTRRHWIPERNECQNYDNVRIDRVVYQPTARLDALLDKLAKGEAVTGADTAGVRKDVELVNTYPDHAAKRAYLEKLERFYKLTGQSASAPARPAPSQQTSCDTLQARVDELNAEERKDIAAQEKLKVDGRVTDGTRWSELNQSRVDRQFQFKRYAEDARAAGCNIRIAQP